MYEIKKINPLSLAKIQAIICGAVVLTGFLLFILIWTVFEMFDSYSYQYILDDLFEIGVSLLITLLITVVASFLAGLVIGYVYNWIAEAWGGVKVDLILVERKE